LVENVIWREGGLAERSEYRHMGEESKVAQKNVMIYERSRRVKKSFFFYKNAVKAKAPGASP